MNAIVAVVVVLLVAGDFTAAQDCTLIVPPDPLSAQGLATPYQLQPPCTMANPDTAAFVQAMIFDVQNSQLYAYNPIVVTAGTQPAIAPVVPSFRNNSIVALWFGFNANVLTLGEQTSGTLTSANCVYGFGGDDDGQFAYCNAVALFDAVQQAMDNGRIEAPNIGTGHDGLPCPTSRDFSIIDQDQSDNIPAGYLLLSDGTVAVATNRNVNTLGSTATLEENASDNGLLTDFVLPALGCTPWMVQDLGDLDARYIPALALNEIQANVWQTNQALVPPNDPEVIVNNSFNETLINLYRAGVFQPPISGNLETAAATYCTNFRAAAQRVYNERVYTTPVGSPDNTGSNLYTFLANRFFHSYINLNCQALINLPSPFNVTLNSQGTAISATFAM